MAWLNKGPKNTRVYLGVIRGNIKVYVGITSQKFRARMSQHNTIRRAQGLPIFLRLKPMSGPLTRNQAQAVEQVLIMANPHFDNQKNSIAVGRSTFQGALEWGSIHLVKSGKALFY